MKEKKNTARAFDAFAEKLNRFITIHGDEPVQVPNGAREFGPLSQESIRERDSQFKSDVIERYKKFMIPRSDEIVRDKAELLSAYDLFKGIEQLNSECGSQATFIRQAEIVCPIPQKARYTAGGDFVYLQCWFMFEKGVGDFCPQIEGGVLKFVPVRQCKFNYRDKEIVQIVRECFYPGSKEV